MNIKTNLLEEYVNFNDSTNKENTYFKVLIVLFVVIISFFSFFCIIFISYRVVFAQLF